MHPIERRLPSKVVFRQRSSFIKGHLPSKVVFCQRLSSFKGRLPLKVVFHQRSFSFLGFSPECGKAQLGPYIVHFIGRDSLYVVHFKYRDMGPEVLGGPSPRGLSIPSMAVDACEELPSPEWQRPRRRILTSSSMNWSTMLSKRAQYWVQYFVQYEFQYWVLYWVQYWVKYWVQYWVQYRVQYWVKYSV